MVIDYSEMLAAGIPADYAEKIIVNVDRSMDKALSWEEL